MVVIDSEFIDGMTVDYVGIVRDIKSRNLRYCFTKRILFFYLWSIYYFLIECLSMVSRKGLFTKKLKDYV